MTKASQQPASPSFDLGQMAACPAVLRGYCGIPPTLNVKTAAEVLHVHPKTVEGLIHSCALPAAKVGRSYVLLAKDVMAYIENQVCRQTSERMRMVRGPDEVPVLNGRGARVGRKGVPSGRADHKGGAA